MEAPSITYNAIKSNIDKRLAEFKETWQTGSVLTELVFCLCTPQTDAHKGWKAATEIMEFEAKDSQSIGKILRSNGVRFHNNKSSRIAAALKMHTDVTLRTLVKKLIAANGSIREARNFIAESTSGLGMKEASHFMRNIGFVDDVAILDRHILRRLAENNVIESVPKLKKPTYLEIEDKMIEFSRQVEVPLGALDLVFWYQSKGEIFK